jgi:hypothetical protein
MDSVKTAKRQKSTSAQSSRWGIGRIFLLSGLVIALVGGAVYLHFNTPAFLLGVHRYPEDPTRDYSRMPFNSMDAVEFCRLKTKSRYGARLIYSYVDEHSSRLEEGTGEYKIFMFIRTGTPQDFQEEIVHCFVDSKKRAMTHYRIMKPLKDPMLDSGAGTNR